MKIFYIFVYFCIFLFIFIYFCIFCNCVCKFANDNTHIVVNTHMPLNRRYINTYALHADVADYAKLNSLYNLYKKYTNL